MRRGCPPPLPPGCHPQSTPCQPRSSPCPSRSVRRTPACRDGPLFTLAQPGVVLRRRCDRTCSAFATAPTPSGCRADSRTSRRWRGRGVRGRPGQVTGTDGQHRRTALRPQPANAPRAKAATSPWISADLPRRQRRGLRTAKFSGGGASRTRARFQSTVERDCPAETKAGPPHRRVSGVLAAGETVRLPLRTHGRLRAGPRREPCPGSPSLQR
jgi:hypothetical protein